MHVSLHLSPQSRGVEEDGAIIEMLVEQALIADAAGMAAITLTEHHFSGLNTYSDPFLFGSYLAKSLSQAYLGITVIQMALHSPMRVVEKCNVLDLLTKGRVLFALAPGSASPTELSAFGVDPEQRSEITRQRIDAVRKIWGHAGAVEPLDVSTDFDRGILQSRLPASFRTPHPLLARATYTEATIIQTAALGWPVILGVWLGPDHPSVGHVRVYREALESSGHDPEIVREGLAWLGFVQYICLGRTEAEARRRFQEYLDIGGSGPTPGKEGVPDSWASEWTERQVMRVKGAIIGTPETIVDEVRRFEEVGALHARLVMVEPSGRDEENRDMFQLFIDEVLPALDPQPLPRPPVPQADHSRAVRVVSA